MNASLLGRLHLFVLVARRGSFSGAARELGVSTSSVSQAIKQLEAELNTTLLARTTRSVGLTEAGRALLDRVGPSLDEVQRAVDEAGAGSDEVVGSVRITLPKSVTRRVMEPVIPVFRARHPRVRLEVVPEDRLVDLVAEGFDAAIRLSESIDEDMVQVRLTEPFSFQVLGAPGYLAQRPAPERPEELLHHDCITFRMQSTGALYAWEFERGSQTWRVPIPGGLVVQDGEARIRLAEQGLGLLYSDGLAVADAVAAGRLVRVLQAYECHVPGFFLCYPSRSQRSPALAAFVATAREVLLGGPALG